MICLVGAVIVSVGENVKVGQIIAQVGSSGSSTHPHLHFELRDAKHRVIDIFQHKLVNFSYHYPKTAYVFEKGITYKDDVNLHEDFYHFTPQKIYTLNRNKRLTFWLKIIGQSLTDKIHIQLIDENNQIKNISIIKSSRNYKYSYWYVNLPSLNKGNYKIKVFFNNNRNITFYNFLIL